MFRDFFVVSTTYSPVKLSKLCGIKIVSSFDSVLVFDRRYDELAARAALHESSIGLPDEFHR